jgi:N-acetylglucosaminyldiphosphoundecaprenol N-acetyl-beta-D-mannosaminyltransferase
MKYPARENILGIGVSAVDTLCVLATIDECIRRGAQTYVCVTGVHGIMEGWRSTQIRRIHNEAGMVTPDGMPLAWLLRFTGHSEARQVCGPELLPALFVAGQENGYRHFLYGANEATLLRLQVRLREAAPHAIIAGAHAPPYRDLTTEEDAAVTSKINDCRPDIVWVGLSTPKQEMWMAAHRRLLNAPVMIGVGAAFDINAGLRRRAPRLLQKTGFEWAYRLAQEPTRLAGRYLRNNPLFLGMITLQMMGLLYVSAELQETIVE